MINTEIKEGRGNTSALTHPTLTAINSRTVYSNRSGDSEKIVVLGGGITGLTAGWELSKHSKTPILLVEKSGFTGGLASSFVERGMTFDVGSHRIHEKYDPEVFAIIEDLLGDDLLKRPRRGRIRIQDIFLDYPPSAVQILTSFGLLDGMRIVRDYLFSFAHHTNGNLQGITFEEYAIRAVGKSLYEKFYRPYAVKLWGVSPDRLSAEPAVSRVKKFNARAIWKEAKERAVGVPASNFFYYPAKGFGQIAGKIQERFLENGGAILFDSTADKLDLKNDSEIEAVQVRTSGGALQRIPTKVLISIVPIDVLHDLIRFQSGHRDPPPLGLSWRSLRILYLSTPDVISSGHETYYFPESDVIFGRVSEPAMYSPLLSQAAGKRALVIEAPCTYGDEMWNMSDDELAERCISDLRRLKILSYRPGGQADYFSRRIKNLYPIYEIGWREKLGKAMERFNSVNNLYMIGRPALFLHCNVDHCMAMALKLARFLSAEK
jgi:protoporphyrinogen oxidase